MKPNNFNNNSKSLDYIMNNNLIGDNLEKYTIMQHLMEVFKDWELK